MTAAPGTRGLATGCGPRYPLPCSEDRHHPIYPEPIRKSAGIAVLSTCLVAAAGCGAITDSSPEARDPSFVTGGSPDGNVHPHVGTLLFVQNGEGYYSCTGTLLSPTVMLTAGHCVESQGKPNDVTYVRFREDALEGIGEYRTTAAWLRAEWIEARSVIAHPQFDDFAAYPATYDVGIVILSKAVELPLYGTLPDVGLLEQLLEGTDERSRMFTAVGYGLQGAIQPFYGDDFVRNVTTTKLLEVNSTDNGGGHSAKFSNSPGKGSGTGGTCNGDSGGPIFHGSSTVIGAITSFGYTPCIGVDFNFRIDTETAQSFIRQYID